jgi:opacity protein-like surface antigen
VGGGLQYAITHHWSVRGQYQYVDLGSVSFDHKGTSPFPGFIGHSEAELREHNVSLAVIFQF